MKQTVQEGSAMIAKGRATIRSRLKLVLGASVLKFKGHKVLLLESLVVDVIKPLKQKETFA